MKYNVKKFVAVVSAAIMTFGAFSVNAFAYTENRVTNQVRVKSGTELTESNAPKLIINGSEDHKENFSFEVYLDNAEWTDKYSEKGELENGVEYVKLTSTRMIINVDVAKFDAVNDDIEIPLYVSVEGSGDAYVGINSKSSAVSSGEYKFATAGTSEIKIYNEPVENMKENGSINEIVIQDDFNSNIKSGTKYTIKLKGGFAFAELPTMDNSGKYSNKTKVEFGNDDKTSLVITVTSGTPSGTGSITLTDIKLDTKNASYGDIKADFTNSAGESGELKFGTFGDSNLTSSEIKFDSSIKYEDDKAVISGTGTKGKILVLTIDDKEIDRLRVDENGQWQFSVDKNSVNDGKTHTIQAAYYNGDTKELYYITKLEYSGETKKSVVYAIGANGYFYNDKQVYTDGVPYIDQSGRTMIPLRTFSNSMGISDTDINWNAQTGEITIKTPEGDIYLKVGGTTISSPKGEIKLECPATIKDNRTYIPLRGVLNAYGISDDNIEWSPSSETITVFY